MTLQQLEYIYNFHDCDVFTPFEFVGDSVTVTFDLAKHLQYDDLKSRYGALLQIKENALIATVKFSNCLELQVKEWDCCYSKSTKKTKKCNERTISPELFDSDMDFISLAISGENKIVFSFVKYGNPDKLSNIQFICQDIDIMEEKLYTASEYDKLCEKYE